MSPDSDQQELRLDAEAIADLAKGAAFLGCGGGGDPYLGLLMAERAVAKHGPPALIPLSGVEDYAGVIVVSMVGAPAVIIERLISEGDLERAVACVEDYVGYRADYILPGEVGGINSLLPIALAAARGRPVVDCDGMGRAFPQIEMTTYSIYGIQPAPLALASGAGDAVLIDTASGPRSERYARAVAIEMGLAVMGAGYPCRGADLKRTAVAGTLSAAGAIGRLIRRRDAAFPLSRILDLLQSHPAYGAAHELHAGRIVDVLRETTGGWSIGRCLIEAQNGKTCSVLFQNENLRASVENGEVLAVAPDLIIIVDEQTLEPVTNETLRYGMRVRVLGVRAPALLRSEQALAVVGPRCFGLEDVYSPLS